MLATVTVRGPRRSGRQEGAGAAARHEPLDRARRNRYLALLRRWARERLPAGANAARDAAEWVSETLLDTGHRDSGRPGESLLVRMRARLLADRESARRARISGQAGPSSRVEQWIGREQLGAWEAALATLPAHLRELVILRVEFGLDYEAIAAEIGDSVATTRAQTVNALAALIDALGRRPPRAA